MEVSGLLYRAEQSIAEAENGGIDGGDRAARYHALDY